MPRNRVTYACQGVFIGPAPGTGYHLVNYTGIYHNTYTDNRPAKIAGSVIRGEAWHSSVYGSYSPTNPLGFTNGPVPVDNGFNDLIRSQNLLMQLERVTNVAYDFTFDRIDVRHLGKRGLVARPVITEPKISLTIEYILNGLKNEARLGFNVDYAQYHHPHSGTPYYGGRVCPVSGMLVTGYITEMTGEPYSPQFTQREKKSIYLVTSPDEDDLGVSEEDLRGQDLWQGINEYSPTNNVLAFGDCCIASYRTHAAVGDVARASVTLDAYYAHFYSSGSGINVPSVETRSGFMITGTRVIIPKAQIEGGPGALQPGDITVSIQNAAQPDIFNLGNVSFTDAKIDSYLIEFDIPREPIRSLGYKLPINKLIDFPIMVNVALDMTVGDGQTGNLFDLLREDANYNLNIRLKNPECYGVTGNAPQQGGWFAPQGAVAIHYEIINAKFQNVAITSSIGSNKRARATFMTEIDPDDFSKGLFISGLLNVAKIEDFVLGEHREGSVSGDGDFITYDDGSPIVTNLRALY